MKSLVIEYLNTCFGDKPAFNKTFIQMYNPYTFANEPREIYELNGRFICKITNEREFFFDTDIISTLSYLFNLDIGSLHTILEDWFKSKIPTVG